MKKVTKVFAALVLTLAMMVAPAAAMASTGCDNARNTPESCQVSSCETANFDLANNQAPDCNTNKSAGKNNAAANCIDGKSLNNNLLASCPENGFNSFFVYLWECLSGFIGSQNCNPSSVPQNISLDTQPNATEITTRQATPAEGEFSDCAQQVLTLVNQERSNAGLQPLTLDQKLTDAAIIRAVEVQSVFEHTRPDGRDCFTAIDEVGGTYRSAGENIAIGYATAEEVVSAWMNSPGHRANILNADFNRLGVGCAATSGSQYGGSSWTQFFAD